MKKITVSIVDDEADLREHIADYLNALAELESIVGADPATAEHNHEKAKP